MTASSSLLQQLLDVGEAMRAALERNDVERFSSLVAERGALLEQLDAVGHPEEIDADWRTYRKALIEQHEQLQQAMQEALNRRTQALSQMKQHADAAREYNTPLSPAQLLNPNLRG